MSEPEQLAALELLTKAQCHAQDSYAPDGYNIGVNVGLAAGQSRMHVHAIR